jgi:hypothetical protein
MSKVTLEVQDVAAHIAGLLAPVTVPSIKLRRDIGSIQVDKVMISEPRGDYPALQFSFEIEGGMGVEIRVRFDQFQKDPKGYIGELLDSLNVMRHAARERRAGRTLEVAGAQAMRG